MGISDSSCVRYPICCNVYPDIKAFGSRYNMGIFEQAMRLSGLIDLTMFSRSLKKLRHSRSSALLLNNDLFAIFVFATLPFVSPLSYRQKPNSVRIAAEPRP